MAQVITGEGGLRQLVGAPLGYSRWVTITQALIEGYGAVTGDREWLHVDPERARSGPFGRTIAHGYLTLSLVTPLLNDIYTLTGFGFGLNYGIDKLRFITPVPVDSHLRVGAVLKSVEAVGEAIQLRLDCLVELRGQAKPALAADLIFRYWVESPPEM